MSNDIERCEHCLPCGHVCPGVRGEVTCPPCLQNGCPSRNRQGQTGDDVCTVCHTDNLTSLPIVSLGCGHMFHMSCIRKMLTNGWPGNRITFSFILCPMCKHPMEHALLTDLLSPSLALQEDVRRKAVTRLQHEGLTQCESVTTLGSHYHMDPTGYAMSRYCYYRCCKCDKAYFGGLAQCEDGLDDDNIRPEHLLCPGCSITDRQQECTTHGTDYLQYKCRYCCTVARYYCFGTTHFCEACHSNNGKMTSMTSFPTCPAGPVGVQMSGKCPLNIDHPPGGTEFALGCGVCANIQTF